MEIGWKKKGVELQRHRNTEGEQAVFQTLLKHSCLPRAFSRVELDPC